MDNSCDQHNFSKNFECIYYPAKVKNVDKAVLTLGGTNQMSEILNQINQKLELRFRPEDPYCKVASGVRSSCTGLLLKVKIIKKKKSGQQTIAIVPQVLGTVSSWFQFRGLCDYQYLPVKSTNDGGVEDFLQSILFKNFTKLEHFNRNVELFLPPVFFSRTDTPQMQLKLFHDTKPEDEQVPENMIGVNRKSRDSFTNVIGFDRESVPQPMDMRDTVERYVRANLLTHADVEAVRQLFEERPVLSKTVIRARVSVPHRKIKLILPLVAYYFYTGPYRIMWVRLGYDPRKDKAAAVYQVLDFRLRHALGSIDKYLLTTRRATLIRLAFRTQKITQEADPEAQLPDRYSVFKPGYIPPFKQMYYQLCDLELPEVQELLASAPLRDECHEKYGWYPEALMDKVRDHLTDNLLNTLESMELENNDTKDGSSAQMNEDDEELDEEEGEDDLDLDLDTDFD